MSRTTAPSSSLAVLCLVLLLAGCEGCYGSGNGTVGHGECKVLSIPLPLVERTG